jgi:Condensation domain
MTLSASGHATLPASYLQERQLRCSQGQVSSHNILSCMRLCGRVDVEALRHTLDILSRRHEPLRTSLALEGDIALQRIQGLAPIALREFEVSHARRRMTQQLNRIAFDQVSHKFDLTTPPLVRGALARLGDQSHVLFLTVHHSMADGWSGRVLFDDLAAIYHSLEDGRPPELPDLPIQFADYADWERNRIDGSAHRYWRSWLARSGSRMDLPLKDLGRHRPGVTEEVYRFDLASPVVTGRLNRLARAAGATLAIAVTAATAALFAPYANAGTVTIGITDANRSLPELRGLVGCLILHLPIRLQVAPSARFVDLLDQARDEVLAAYAHSLPLDAVASGGGLPLHLTSPYDILLNFQPFPLNPGPVSQEHEDDHLRFLPYHPPVRRRSPKASCAWTGALVSPVVTRTRQGGLRGNLFYNGHRVCAATARMLADAYAQVMSGVAVHPYKRIDAVNPLAEGYSGTRRSHQVSA